MAPITKAPVTKEKHVSNKKRKKMEEEQQEADAIVKKQMEANPTNNIKILENLIKTKEEEINSKKTKIADYEKKISELEKSKELLNGRLYIRKKKDVDLEIAKLNVAIENLKNGTEEKNFKDQTQKYLSALENANKTFEFSKNMANEEDEKKEKFFDMTLENENALLENVNTPEEYNNVVDIIFREFSTEFSNSAPKIHITQQDLCPSCKNQLLLSVTNSLLICKV